MDNLKKEFQDEALHSSLPADGFVCLGNRLELFFGSLLNILSECRYLVRMVFDCQFPIGFLDLLVCGVRRNLENPVVVGAAVAAVSARSELCEY